MSSPKPITIRKERFYAHPPEDVWAAITDPHALAEWMEANDHQPIAGHTFHFRCDPGICGSGVTQCEVLEATPGRKLVWSWVSVPADPERPSPQPMTISWTLEPKDGGTLLVLEHSGAEHASWFTRNMMRVGWGYMMKKLIARVLTHVSDGRFTPGAIPMAKRAYTCKSIPENFIR